MNKEMMKGSIDLILLSIIAKRDMYGYEIVQQLKQSTDQLYNMSEGTLYPALKRLENQGAIQAYWVEQPNTRPRKYYKITDAGHASLAEKLSEWRQINQIITSLQVRGLSYE